jgi:hypothetical protein
LNIEPISTEPVRTTRDPKMRQVPRIRNHD